ncbi:hypothetical protein [Agrobacterium genomosp. 13]|uniref:Uncharacterized protein n=1 Tax=Agrobacterium genomosp. 13 str. CFBP 6927 TaxID=1183428 RepID=A0ABM9VIZ7_9HYPH|nr:hypothetical protein [Agrobacterium genomosp. 13]CUX47104.1 conserved exported hypothetical protein [Agrobacterium genomosp. 13 str. CFBP 6927]
MYSRLSARYSSGLAALLTLAFLLSVGTQVRADENLAGIVADGKAWEMYVVKRKVYNILVLRPDGSGELSDGLVNINPTWRAISGGICMTPRRGDKERCVQLKRMEGGIVASQDGAAIWQLSR